jgi:hypothetical protein
MIALQARGPQLPDLSRQTAQYANMMNMARQQEAAQRQASLAQQQMANANADEARRAELHGPALKKAQLEYVGLVADKFREDVAKVRDGDTAGAEAARAAAVDSVPGWGNMIPPVSQWTPEVKAQLMLKAKEIVDKIYPDATASLEVSTDGIPMSTVIGGFPSAAQQRPVYDAQDPATQTTSAPPATPTATPELAPSAGPVANGKYGEARFIPDNAVPLTDFEQEDIRRIKGGSGMTDTPASFTGGSMGAGQMTPEVMSRIADSAFQTGVIAQVDFDQLLATQPPENRQAFTDAFRRANVTVQADAPSLADSGMGQQQYDGQTPQSIYAKLPAQQMPISNADLGSQPMTRQTLAQTQPRTITRIQQKMPNVAPAPAETPQQAGDRARNIRQTPAEAAAITAAIENTKVGIQRDARIAEEIRIKTKGRKLFSTVLNDMRGDYQTLNKLRAIPSTGRPMLDNFGDAISSSFIGRKVQSAAGSQASVALNNIANSKLTLFNALKEATGLSSTQLNSNVELMTYLDSLADPTQGYESAIETIRRLENLYGAPAPAQRQTPTKSSSGWGRAKVVGN